MSVINLIKWPIKSRDSWIESTIGYYDWTLAQSDDAQDKNHTRQDLRYYMSEIFGKKPFSKQLAISKILPSVIFILSVITLSQCPIIIPDCQLNSRIPRFDWPLYQIDDAQDKNDTRQDLRYTDLALKSYQRIFFHFCQNNTEYIY